MIKYEEMTKNQQKEVWSGVRALILIVASLFPASYLMFEVGLGWATFPAFICLFLWFAFWLSWISVCKDRYKKTDTT